MRSFNPNEKVKAQYEGLTDGNGRFNGQIRLMEKNLDLPLKTRKPTVWAVWNDLFHESVPLGFIAEAFSVMRKARHHRFLLLTKRPLNLKLACDGVWPKDCDHIWIGTTCENQEQADKRIPVLLQIPAAVRFVSVEPMLGPVSLAGFDGKTYRAWLDSLAWKVDINWVICGGESGPGARPMHPDWARSLRNQCQAAGVSYFFKQHGEWRECEPPDQWDSVGYKTMQAHGTHFARLGKKKAGRLLDGVEHNGMPGE